MYVVISIYVLYKPLINPAESVSIGYKQRSVSVSKNAWDSDKYRTKLIFQVCADKNNAAYDLIKCNSPCITYTS